MTAAVLPPDAIEVGERDRVDLGDVAALDASIEAVGLLHPVVVTATEDGHALVAGGRRLAAVRHLGWAEVPVTVVTLATVEDALRAEWDENARRKPLTAWESEAAAERRLPRMKALAKANQAHGQTAPGRNAPGKLPEASEVDARRSRALAAVGTGYGARTLAKVAEVRHVVEDETVTVAGRTITVTPAVREVAVAAAEALAQPGAKVDAAHRAVREAILDAHVDDGALRLARWRRTFAQAISRAGEPLRFAPADVCDQADAELVEAYRGLVADLSSHLQQIASAPRLRAVGPGAVRRG